MNIRSLFFTFAFIFSVEQMSVEPAAAQTTVVDRTAVVRAAYENFISTVYLLSGSDRFLSDLSPDERKQFELLGHRLVPHQFRLGHVVPGSDRTSKLIPNTLRFSANNDDFILKPGEPVRTAKMDSKGDIWFNLNFINDPKSEYGLLDAYQHLVHEFGHLIQAGKDQAAIQQVAAKIRDYLRASVRDIEVSPTVRVTTQLPPYLFYDKSTVDFQPEPIVLIAKDGVTYETHLDVVDLKSSEQSYVPSRPNELHGVTRVVVSPDAQMYRGQLLFKWRVEGSHFLVDTGRFNFIDLFSNVEKVQSRLSFEPYFDTKIVYQFVDLEKLTQHQKLTRFAEVSEPAGIATGHKWLEPLRVTSNPNGRTELAGVLESDRELHEITAKAEFLEGVFQIPGTLERLTGNIYRVGFSVPITSTLDGSIRITSLTQNAEFLLNLSEPIKLPVVSGQPVMKVSALSPEAWDGRNWIPVDRITHYELVADDIRMRFQIPGTSTMLNHIELKWLVQDDIFRSNENVGMRTRTFTEVIPREQLNQSFINGILVVEFRSAKASRPTAEVTGRDGFAARDSGYRAFIHGKFVDQNLNVAAVGSRLTKSGWRSLFKLSPPKNPAPVRTCEGLFH